MAHGNQANPGVFLPVSKFEVSYGHIAPLICRCVLDLLVSCCATKQSSLIRAEYLCSMAGA